MSEGWYLPSGRLTRDVKVQELGLNLAIAGVASLLVGICLAFFLEYLRDLPCRTRAA